MKSHEQDMLLVYECIIHDARVKCTTDISKASVDRDLLTLRLRSLDEGVSLFTITLPNYGSDFERCLDRGQVIPTDFQGWKRRLSLPAFLQGFLNLVFDAGTGRLLDVPDINAIEGIRQIAYSFKKMALQCSPKRVNKAMSDYKEVESELTNSMPFGDDHLFSKVCRLLWGSLFNESYDSREFHPKHGPGQTAERVSGNRKYSQRTWTERLEPFFPSDSYIMSCVSQFDDEAEGYKNVQMLGISEELPVRVVSVPKTLKGPRIIAMEPVAMQYAQQALSAYLVPRIEEHYITRGHINFTDQSVNRSLALSASSDMSLATLDLSAASDRVPLSHVTTMLEVNRNLLDAILACRSVAAQLPSGEILNLKKFASMGSALCFPIEAMYFFSVITVALMRKYNLPVSLSNIYNVTRDVYIYGDDIIIPVDEVDVVSETLTDFYCKVNASKSFWVGKFRESCGMDAYDGCEVTPTYIRQIRPRDKDSAKEIISYVATSNLLYKRGYWKSAALLKDWVERIVGKLPIIRETSPGLGWISFQRHISVERWCTKLHRFEVTTYVPSPVYKQDRLEGYSALLKCFVMSQNRSFGDMLRADKEHLTRSPRSGTVCIKRRRTTPY